MSRGMLSLMVHAYKSGISEGVFTDHRIGIRFTGKQTVLLYLSDTHTHFYVSLVLRL
jgi:hypothetical protein